MPLRLISFDAAGTLIQVKEPVGVTYAACAARHGIAVEPGALKKAFRELWSKVPLPHWPEGERSPDDDRTWWHNFAAEVFAHALRKCLPTAQFDPLFDELYHHYEQAAAWTVYDDVRPVLDALVDHYQLCVLSNFDRRLVKILEGHDLRRYFRHIVLSSEVGASKPNPRMFLTAARLHDVESSECLHVGDDDLCDIQGAKQSGWQSFSVKRPQPGLAGLMENVCKDYIQLASGLRIDS